MTFAEPDRGFRPVAEASRCRNCGRTIFRQLDRILGPISDWEHGQVGSQLLSCDPEDLEAHDKAYAAMADLDRLLFGHVRP